MRTARSVEDMEGKKRGASMSRVGLRACYEERVRFLGAAPAEPHITIYDAHHRTRLPGSAVPQPSDSTDPEVKEAFAGLLATFTLYWEVFKRNSIDDHGMPLLGSVHFSQHYDNAFFNGQQM